VTTPDGPALTPDATPKATPQATPDPGTARRPEPPRHTPSAPGAKRARHKRWTRVAAGVTIVGLLGFGAFLVKAGPSLWKRKTVQEMQTEGCFAFLDGLANRVRGFQDLKKRLPDSLAALRDPDLPSDHDAEPWDCWAKPIEYRIVDEARGEFRLRSYGPDKLPDSPDDIHWPSNLPWR